MRAQMPETGLVIFAKRECETCAMVEPVFGQIADSGVSLLLYTQDDPTFPRPIWGETLRPVRRREDSVEPGALAEALRAALRDSAPGSSTGA